MKMDVWMRGQPCVVFLARSAIIENDMNFLAYLNIGDDFIHEPKNSS